MNPQGAAAVLAQQPMAPLRRRRVIALKRGLVEIIDPAKLSA